MTHKYKNIIGEEVDIDKLQNAELVKLYKLFQKYFHVVNDMLSLQHVKNDKKFSDYVSNIAETKDALKYAIQQRKLRIADY